MSKKIDLSRREFLLNSTLLSAAGTVAAPFALNLFSMNVAAASTFTSDYKALVCIFLAGGNDHNNMVLATDTPSWTGYQAARNIGGGASIALPLANLQTLSVTKNDFVGARTFALHPNMAQMKNLFEAGRAAIIANVGPLIGPIADKVAYKTSQKPNNLFSHSDQTSQWQSTDPSKKNNGWGGRMSDLIKTSNSSQNFSCLSLSGNTAFLAGETINQYQINANGSPVAVSGFNNLFGTSGNFVQPIITTPTSGNLFEIEHAAITQRAINAQTSLTNVLSLTATNSSNPSSIVPAPSQYQNPNLAPGTLSNNGLANQLKTVARIIAGRNTLGAHRQVFYVTIGGFDTHDGQAIGQADLMARLSHAIDYFDTTLKTLGDTTNSTVSDMSSSVTTFTASDFGRTFTSNGDGTDHGWGAHHFVVGGAVKGKDIYGSFPMTAVTKTSTGIDNPLDVGSGNFIPQVSVDQYAATLAKWFGLNPTTEIPLVFPNLANFPIKDLGFML